MKITNIKQQVRRTNRYSVYIDGKYTFSLSEDELLNKKFRVGQEFDEVEYDVAQKIALEDKAYMRSLDLLARRPRSVWEMEKYLKQKGYKNNIVNKILNKLISGGLLDDKKFAYSWVRDRRTLKSISKRRLLLELQQKHISDQIISNVLNQDETNEHDVLRLVIAKKSTQTRYRDKQKLIAYLLRQGFNYEDIKQVINHVLKTV